MADSRLNPKGALSVALDPTSIAEEGAGYRVHLTGPFDASWIRAYFTLWTGLTFFSRFDLDVASRTAWFPLPEADARHEVGSMLQILDGMLKVTSHCAQTPSGSGPPIVNPSQRRNRLTPAAGLALHLPAPAPLPPPVPARARREDPGEHFSEGNIDSLVAEDLIEL
jgi:hypothetical protein